MCSSRQFRVAILCVLVVAIAGCAGLLGDEITEEELLSEVEDAEPPSEIAATVETNASLDGDVFESEFDAWYRISGETRVEVETEVGQVIEVNDGATLWSYNTNDSTVQEREPFTNDSVLGESIETTEALITNGTVTEIRETEYEGREAYLVVFDETGHEMDDTDDAGGFLPPVFPGGGNVFAGSESTDGAEGTTESAPMQDADRVELVIDAEHMFLLRQTVEGDQQFEFKYTDIEFEPGLDDSLFEFEVPDDATVEEIELAFEEFETIDEAKENVQFEIEEPEFDTQQVELDEATVRAGGETNATNVNLQYDTPDGELLMVEKGDNPRDTEDDGERVQIAEMTGTYEELTGGFHQLSWQVDGFEYSIFASTDIDEERLVKLAESMETG